jgi:anaphase-promoting complex subunit 3
MESDKDDDAIPSGDVGYSPSPPSAALSPRSEVSPSPSNWTSAQEQLAQEEYENDLAEQYIYDLIRRFARATRALALYDCQRCLEELEQLPHVQQNSPWVIAIVGRAHYERQDYASVRVIIARKSLSLSTRNFITG